MSIKRRSYSAVEKARIALAALKGELTQNQLTSKYGVHSTQINHWKRQLKEGMSAIFLDKRGKDKRETGELIDSLYQQIGQLKVELDWLKKKPNYSTEQKRCCIDAGCATISINRQCELIGLERSSYYYNSKEMADENIQLMHLIDEGYTRHSFLGTRRMKAYCVKAGYSINRKRLQRLYRQMGIEAVYPKPRLSRSNKKDVIYPYLLSGITINKCNQVWSTDITYVRLRQGFVYLMAIIDWHSRFVLDWQVSTSLEADFCIDTLSRVLLNARCDIFNTDQGAQFTAKEFTSLLQENNIQISMDGRGRYRDNIFVERLWRSVK